MRLHRNTLLVITLIIWSCVSFTQDHIQFKSYTINDGLSQSVISSVAQDDLGALWIGTQDGINRFNGKEFDVFTTDAFEGIANEYIFDVKKDSDGKVWFGTNKGLVSYDPKLESFNSYFNTINNQNAFRSIGIDRVGTIWAGTLSGSLVTFNPKTETFNLIEEINSKSAIISVFCDYNTIIVATEYDGVFSFNSSTKEYQNYSINPLSNAEIIVNKLLKSPNEGIVLLTSLGVFELDKESKEFRPSKSNFFLPFQQISITDLLFIPDDRYFVASENKGLYQVLILEDSLDVINHTADHFQKGALSSDRINSLYQDKKGVVWISTQRGLNSFDPNSEGFKGVGFSVNLDKGLPTKNVWRFREDSSGNYLFIAGDHGITRFNRKTHYYEHFYRISGSNNEDITTLDMHVISKNKLIVACFDGLFELTIDRENPKNHNYRPLINYTNKERDFEKTYSILPYKKENTFLVGTKAGVILYNHNSGKVTFFKSDDKHQNWLGSGPVRYMFKTSENRFFLCPSTGGIFEFIETQEGFQIELSSLFRKVSEKSNDYITSSYETKEGAFWFGTMGDGLYFFNPLENEIKHYNKQSGLPNNVIYGVQKSPKDPILWLSTNRGLVKYRISQERFTNFSEADGLKSDELNFGALFQSLKGNLYIGGIMGYNFFNPAESLTKTSKLNVFFSKLEVDNEEIRPNQKNSFIETSIAFTNSIALPYTKRNINLHFYADDLSNPDRIEYRFTLKGSSEVDEFLGATNQLRFTSLAPGKYTLHVYARHFNGEWTINPAKLTITIESPFWLSWWFYVIITGVVALMVLIIVKRSIEKERRQQVKLELKIAERTREIREKSLQIERQKERLEKQKVALEMEKEKSERLLNNILPEDTATQLKKDGRSAARDFSLVTVMFTDFVGFTQVAEKMNAKDLVAILDRFFRKFDEIIDAYDLEKIKTIGDSYMCAGGVPIRSKTNPINTVLAAIQIQEYMREREAEAIKNGEIVWKLRIGINTGPVSAGVIGSKRYAYDIWGRTVNRAQRMEQMCTPGSIAISEDTYEHVQPYFEFVNKGKVQTKSGLKIHMLEVTSIKKELSVNGEGVLSNDAFHKLVQLHVFSKINYSKAERYIMHKLQKELSKKLHYHSIWHTKDVTRQVERIALGEGITDEDLFLLKTAASYHDAGFITQYEKNEPVGAQLAQEILPNFGYTQDHIDRIKELIYATQVPHQPKNKLEEIICDADLDYLGRDDFHEIADKLRVELREHGKLNSDRKWDETQVSFLTQHRYFTRTSIQTRRMKKTQNLAEIKKRLEENNYKD